MVGFTKQSDEVSVETESVHLTGDLPVHEAPLLLCLAYRAD